jgi:hypothetical protein
VVDASGAPVRDAEVWAGVRGDWTQSALRQARRAAVTAADGTFACDAVQGETLLAARRDGHAASWAQPVDQLGDGPITLRLGVDPGAIVATLAVPAGAPLPEASVQVHWLAPHWLASKPRRDADAAVVEPPLPQVADDDGAGRAVARGLRPGRYEVVVQWPGRRARETVHVAAGGTAHVSFSLTPGAVVSGRVRGACSCRSRAATRRASGRSRPTTGAGSASRASRRGRSC